MDRHFSAMYPANTRFDEIQEVLGFVRAGNASQIIGIPGVGRTLFLSLLAFNKKVRELHLGEKAEHYHFVLFDFTPLKAEPLDVVVKSILLAVAESLDERGMEQEVKFVKTIFHEQQGSTDAVVQFQGLRRAVDFLAHEKTLSVVFLFDAFEAYAPHLDQRLFPHLASLRDHLRYNVSFIFSLNRPLETVVDSELASSVVQLISGHTVWLSPADDAGNRFLKEFLEKQFDTPISGDLYKSVVAATGGLARLMKVALEEAVQKGVQAAAFAGFAEENRAIRSVLYEIWDSLHADEQLALKQSVLQAGTGGEEQAIAYLRKVQLLDKSDQLAIPLFYDFVSYRARHLQASAYAYREETNDILKGDTVISENFTASEFRLLSYLLQHEEQLVSRDELISAAWSDAKSTAGVTDQALDQLLYRLRRKIEEDPNTPRHLLTVKGRGIKFTP